MTKKELRNIILEKRKSLSLVKVRSLSLKIIDHLNEGFDFSDKEISTFLGIPEFNEFDSWQFINKTTGNCYAPVMMPERQLVHRYVDESTELRKNKWGILEPVASKEINPEEFDFVIVPLLVGDQKGNRLGYGGGYYDRFLKKCKTSCKFIGVGFFDVIENIPEINENDVPIHYYASPKGIIKF